MTEEEILSEVLVRFPGFSPAWEEYLRFWGDEPHRGFCNDIGEFARYVALLLRDGVVDESRLALAYAEELLHSGNGYVENAICTCFLENLANKLAAGEFKPESIFPLLGPESRKYIAAWNEFTE